MPENQSLQGGEKRLAILSILVYDKSSVAAINELLHRYSEYVIGRMGLPYAEKNVAVICVVLDAPNDTIGALSGQLGRLPQVSAKTLYAREQTRED